MKKPKLSIVAAGVATTPLLVKAGAGNAQIKSVLRDETTMAQNLNSGIDPGRVKVEKTADGLTVVTPSGERLRGGKMEVSKAAREGGFTGFRDSFSWESAKDAGLNAMRIICFDAWMHRFGDTATDFTNTSDVNALFEDLDAAINNAAEHGMYVMINLHDIGWGWDDNYSRQFWSHVAPRYQSRTHVLYELSNEPDANDEVKGEWAESVQEFLNRIKPIYEQMREKAPETHIVLFSFATAQKSTNTSLEGEARNTKMASFAELFSNETTPPHPDWAPPTVDWTKCSVGYHAYYNGGSSNAIRELIAKYPSVNTEQNFPKGVVNPQISPTSDYDPMDSDWLGTQTMERLGQSWFHWEIDNRAGISEGLPDEIDAFFIYYPVILNDALKKGYFWRTSFPKGEYKLTVKSSNKVLDVENGWTDDGTNVQQWEWSGSSNAWELRGDFNLNQRWRIELLDGGYYRLIATHSGKVLDVSGPSMEQEANVHQWTWLEGTNQQWSISEVETGYFRLSPRHAPDMALDVQAGSPADGANVWQYSWNGSDPQKWALECVQLP